MIITHFNKKINTILPDLNKLEALISKSYNDSVNSLNFDNILCPNCHGSLWIRHAYYFRTIFIFNQKIRIRITRIMYKSCGKTHAILAEDMIPFISLTFHDLYKIVITALPILNSSHFYYLKHKFSCFIDDYFVLCKFNSRNLPVIFITT